MIEFCITKYDDDTLEEQFLLADASVTMLFQKGYRKLYNMCRNIPRNNIIDFDELVVQALNKNSKYVSSEDQVTGTIAAAYFFVNYLVEDDQIENQESMDELILARQEYVQTLSDDNLFYQSDQKDEIEHYIKELPKCENFLFSFLQAMRPTLETTVLDYYLLPIQVLCFCPSFTLLCLLEMTCKVKTKIVQSRFLL